MEIKMPSFFKFWESSKSLDRKPVTVERTNIDGIEENEDGSYFYTLSGLNNFIDRMGADVRIDMSTLIGKRKALLTCTPFASVIDKCGSMFSIGNFYVQDADGDEHNSPKNKDGKTDSLYQKYESVRKLLRQPNALQSGRQFNKQVEINLKTFGYCAIYIFRSIPSELPLAMWIIPPEIFKAELTGSLWMQSELSGIIKKAYIEWGGKQIELEEHEYFIISDANAIVSPNGDNLAYQSKIDSLTEPVSNWMAQMRARGTLIVDGGPKGIICDDSGGDIYGNSSLDSKEQDNLNSKFKKRFGIVNKLYSILVTTAKLKWVPITANTKDLMLHDEDDKCRDTIADTIGINTNLVKADSKYENQASSEKAAYQNLIIPDAENYTEALTRALNQDGVFIKLDYTHVSALQENKADSARAFSLASTAARNLYNDKILTLTEVRKELANYIDINPDEPEGKFKAGEVTNQNQQQQQNSEEDGGIE